MNRAIAEKNVARAMNVADFTRRTWSSNFMEGNKSYAFKMLQYFRAVKDTATYVRMAVSYYDQYYMNISVDSMNRRDSLNFEAAKMRARANGSDFSGFIR